MSVMCLGSNNHINSRDEKRKGEKTMESSEQDSGQWGLEAQMYLEPQVFYFFFYFYIYEQQQ